MKNTDLMGKFRAKVVNINDPNRQGRIKVSCPRVLFEATSAWCLPCIPCATDGVGDYFLPKVGDSVWIEFEEGDISKPIWSGGWYSENQIPISAQERVDLKRVITYNGSIIELSEGAVSISSTSTVNLKVGSSTLSLDSGRLSKLKRLIDRAD